MHEYANLETPQSPNITESFLVLTDACKSRRRFRQRQADDVVYRRCLESRHA